MTLSLCMIVKNEEDVLERCLNSFNGVFDEIVIVDTGSTDNTIKIAKKFTDKIYHFKWINDFSAARNFSFSKATSDFIMWADADDIIVPTEREKLIKFKKNLTQSVDVVMLKYAISFDENNNPTFVYFRERIFNRTQNFKWKDPVHEAITPKGNIKYENITIEHRKTKPTAPGRNLKIYENLKKEKVLFSPRQTFYYARELYYNNKFNKAIVEFKKFIKMPNGFKENYIEACLNLSFCYQHLNKLTLAKQSLFNSFAYDTPRSEILCELANIYFLENNYKSAIYYYNLATKNTPNHQSGAFVLNDCYNFIPYIQQCVCYYKLKNINMALKFHKLAKKIKPNNKLVLANDKFFKEIIKSKKNEAF